LQARKSGDFSDLVKHYGEAVEASDNGLNFIYQDKAHPLMIRMLRLCPEGLMFMKEIDVKQAIKSYIMMKPGQREECSKFEKEYEQFFDDKNSMCTFVINDKGDVAVRIQCKLEQEFFQLMSQIFDDDLRTVRDIMKHHNKMHKLRETISEGSSSEQAAKRRKVLQKEHMIKDLTKKLSQQSRKVLTKAFIEQVAH